MLKEGIQPINLKPFKYSSMQKDIIKNMVRQVLEVSVVRASTSAYSNALCWLGRMMGRCGFELIIGDLVK